MLYSFLPIYSRHSALYIITIITIITTIFTQLNDDYYECLTKETTIALLEACKAGAPPKMGKWGSLPMNGQVSCEGPLGKTSLFDVQQLTNKDPALLFRTDIDLSVQRVDPADVKRHMGY